MSNLHRVISFNINGTWGEDASAWAVRGPLCAKTIKRYKPDILGLQEATQANIDTLLPLLAEYTLVQGNCYGDNPPQEHNSFLFKSGRYELLAEGEFWYSDTPDVESSGWGVEYPMGATWIKLRCKSTDAQLVCLNTHFEDGDDGVESRNKASQLIVERLPMIAPELPVMLMGDFNCNPWWPPYHTFMNAGFSDTYRAAGHADSTQSSSVHFGMGSDYFSLDYGNDMFWRVDWILVRDGFQQVQTVSADIVKDAEPPTYPSDHYPIVCEVRIG